VIQPVDKFGYQQRDIFGSISQRRQVDRYDIDAEKKIIAKLVSGDKLLEIFIRGGDDAHIH